MYSSISPPQLSPNCFIPQAFSFGLNDEMNFTSMPMFHHYFTTPLIPPSNRTTPSIKLMLSPKSTPTKTHQPNDQLNEPMKRKQSSQKKDRNCKIVTAHGLRDRRVRLSMDIARRFFDLQDSLGFDTASKTLDWLLTKSRTAIKELQTEPGNAKQSEAYVNEDSLMNNNSTFCTKKRVAQSSQVEDKDEGFAQKNYCVKSLENKSAKEVRAKARERVGETMPADPPRYYSEPFGLLQPIKSCKTCESELFCFCLLNGIAQSEETFGNNLGTVITKKLKPSTVTSDNLEMNSCNTLFCSNNMICYSGDLQEIFGGIQQ